MHFSPLSLKNFFTSLSEGAYRIDNASFFFIGPSANTAARCDVLAMLAHNLDKLNRSDGLGGRDGLDALVGLDGSNGIDGLDALVGLDGRNGLDGLDALVGLDGSNGLDALVGRKDGDDGNVTY